MAFVDGYGVKGKFTAKTGKKAAQEKAKKAEAFRAQEKSYLTKSIGTAGPKPSVDMSSGGDDDKQKVWNVISDLKNKGVEQTLKNLTTRWFTDDFIEKNPDLVSRRLKQVIDTDKDVFINVFKIYAETEMISWLKEIKKPCLFMTGENDGGCTPFHNERMSNEIEISKLVIIPKVKHSFLIEAPEQITKNLLEFIESL